MTTSSVPVILSAAKNPRAERTPALLAQVSCASSRSPVGAQQQKCGDKVAERFVRDCFGTLVAALLTAQHDDDGGKVRYGVQ
jgi:hypothetical protein